MTQLSKHQTLIALLSILVLSSCGGGGSSYGGGSSGGNNTGGNTSTISITSLGESSGTPLTALTISTTGGSTDAVTVTYSNSSGYSVSGKAVSVTSSSVTVPIPLYINPSSKDTSSGSVSITLTQDGYTSAPASFTIEDLPALSTYGVSTGQISHAFLIYEQLLLGHTMNEMSAVSYAMASNSTVANESNNAVATIFNTAIPAVNDSRFDVDQAMNANAVSVWGTTGSGQTLQFDQDQLQFMDRVLAIYILNQYGTLSVATRDMSGMTESISPGTPRAVTLGTTLAAMTTINGAYGLLEDVRVAGESAANKAVAFVSGLGMVADQAGSEDLSHYVGMVSGLQHVGQAIDSEFTGILKVPACIAGSCDDPDALQADIQNSGLNVAGAVASAIEHVDGLVNLEDNAASSVSQSLQSFINVNNMYATGEMQNVYNAAISATDAANYSSVVDAMGALTGGVSITNTLGAAASLPGVQLQQCAPGTCATSFFVTAAIDTGGSYDLVVPEDLSGINYGSMIVDIFDPITFTGLVSETVNLTGLNTNAPVIVPSMSYVCDDTDYGSPDGDDPDCD